MEADGEFSMENNPKDYGQATDFFFQGNSSTGYTNTFSDTTKPSSQWWDGKPSGIRLKDFSPVGTTMTFVVDSASVLNVTDVGDSAPGGAYAPAAPAQAARNAPSRGTVHHLHLGHPFQVTVLSQNSQGEPVAVSSDTTVVLSLKTGTGNLAGTLSGVIEAGSCDVTFSGLTYSKAEDGIVLAASTNGGDALSPDDSDPIDDVAAPWLEVVQVNRGVSPRVGIPFSVYVEVRDGSDLPVPVTAETEIQLALLSGSGELGGNLRGVIPAGQTGVTIQGVTYSAVDTGVEITASAVRGDNPGEGDSAPFRVGSAGTDYPFGSCDLVLLAHYIGVPPDQVPPYVLASYDFNENGEIDAADRNALADYLGSNDRMVY